MSTIKNKLYWTTETDKLIDLYNLTKCHKTFDLIYPAIDKLCENIVFRNQYIIEKEELITHIYEQLWNFSSSKGSGFGYFNMCAINYIRRRYKDSNSKKAQKLSFIEDLVSDKENVECSFDYFHHTETEDFYRDIEKVIIKECDLPIYVLPENWKTMDRVKIINDFNKIYGFKCKDFSVFVHTGTIVKQLPDLSKLLISMRLAMETENVGYKLVETNEFILKTCGFNYKRLFWLRDSLRFVKNED